MELIALTVLKAFFKIRQRHQHIVGLVQVASSKFIQDQNLAYHALKASTVRIP